jgi:hypothetical protein
MWSLISLQTQLNNGAAHFLWFVRQYVQLVLSQIQNGNCEFLLMFFKLGIITNQPPSNMIQFW